MHQHLRQATADAHRRVENALHLMDDQLTLPRYTRILAAFQSIYRPLESLLSAAAANSPFAPLAAAREKTSRLAQDLLALGYTAGDVAAIAPSRHLPALPTPHHALGALYVIEGAALGGQFIARHVTALLHLTPLTGLAFFTGEGPHTAARWQNFRNLLNAQPASAADALTAAALDTFACFENTFAEV